MNEEHQEREGQKNAGLTTAALAGVGERTAASVVSAAGIATALAPDEQASSRRIASSQGQ